MRLSILFVRLCRVLNDGQLTHHDCPFQILTSAWVVAAKVIVITVGGNTTDDGTTTFVPQRVDAALGDEVHFNCMPSSFSLLRADQLQSHEWESHRNRVDFQQPMHPGTRDGQHYQRFRFWLQRHATWHRRFHPECPHTHTERESHILVL